MKILEEHKFVFDKLEHKPTRTYKDSAQVRCTSLESGAKAMLAKQQQMDSFYLFSPHQRKLTGNQ